MPVKRLTTLEQRKKLKDLKKYKAKKFEDLTDIEKDDLIKLMAEKLGFL